MVMMKAIWLNFVWHLIQPQGSSKSGEESTDSGSALNTLSNTPESPVSRKPASDHRQPPPPPQMDAAGGIDSPRISGSQSHPAAKPTPEKVCFTFPYSWLILPITQEKKRSHLYWPTILHHNHSHILSLSLSHIPNLLSHISQIPKTARKICYQRGTVPSDYWGILWFLFWDIIKA